MDQGSGRALARLGEFLGRRGRRRRRRHLEVQVDIQARKLCLEFSNWILTHMRALGILRPWFYTEFQAGCIYYSLLKELLQLSLGGAWAAAWAEGLGGSLGGLFGAWAEAWARSDEIQCTRIVCQEFPCDAVSPLVICSNTLSFL